MDPATRHAAPPLIRPSLAFVGKPSRMDCIQDQHERAVGGKFVKWYNALKGTAFGFAGRAGEAPDLIYRDGQRELRMEITDCYYDADDAKVKWQNAREVRNAPTAWSGVNADAALRDCVQDAIQRKCEKCYGPDCILVVNVSPAVTTAEEMGGLLRDIRLPSSHCFNGVFVTGDFGVSSNGSEGGYRAWELQSEE